MRKLYLLGVATILASCETAPSKDNGFTGTWVGNEAESMVPPGQHMPKNVYGIMEDDGRMLHTTQVTTDENGNVIRKLVGNSECDGKASFVHGTTPPNVVTLSCHRVDARAYTMELKDVGGYSHIETCRMSKDGQKHACAGTQLFPDGSKHDFSYVFDRKK